MRQWLISLVVTGGLVLGFAGMAVAQSSASGQADNIFEQAERTKKQDIRKLIEMTGAARLAGRVIDKMLKRFKKRYDGVPKKAWTDIRKELQDLRQDFVDKLVPIYDEHLNHSDIKRMIEFYKTETGQKFVDILPKIVKKSHQVGRKWSSRVKARTIQLLRLKGYSLDN